MVIKCSSNLVGVHTWHTVSMERKRKRGSLKIDGAQCGRKLSRAHANKILPLEGSIMAGGMPDKGQLKRTLDVNSGFHGCLEGVSGFSSSLFRVHLSLARSGRGHRRRRLFLKENSLHFSRERCDRQRGGHLRAAADSSLRARQGYF